MSDATRQPEVALTRCATRDADTEVMTQKTSQRPTRQEIIGYWPDIAFQHYVLARVAMRSGYWYAAAGCAHFAVELIVKYTLVLPQPWYGLTWPSRGRVYTSGDLPRHHNLVRLWSLMDL